MTHVSVLVPFERNGQIFEPERAVSLKLLPYHQFCGPREELRKEIAPYVTFEDREVEYLREFENGQQQCIRMPNGKLTVMNRTMDFLGCTIYRRKPLPRGCQLVDIPYRDIYKTFEAFMFKHYHMRRDKKFGRYGVYINTNGYFDWYVIGGRWSGLLRMKRGAEKRGLIYPNLEKVSETAAIQNEPVRADIALVSDVDWPAMYEEAIKAKLAQWNDWQECFRIAASQPITDLQSEEACKWWEMNQDARAQYPLLGNFVHLYAAKRAMEKSGYGMLSLQMIRDLQNSRDDYVRLHAREALTAAFIDLDGRWHESDCNDIPGEYNEEFWNFIHHLPPGTWVAVVDIHY